MKKVLTFIFLLLTVALAAGAIFAGYYLTQVDTAPDDSSAGEACNSSCNGDGDCFGGMRCKNNQCKFCLDSLCNNTTCTNPNPPAPPPPAGGLHPPGWSDWNIGGYPLQTITADRCFLFANPCDAQCGKPQGYDAWCVCEPVTSMPTQNDVSCNQPCGGTAKWGAPIGQRAGTGTACAPYCGDGVKEGTEQCDDGNTNNNDACSNACTPNAITCYRCTVGLDDENTCESQSVNGTSCPTGWTTNSACEQEVTGDECPQDVEIVDCGEACESDEQCGTDQTCDAGICKRDICLEEGACSDDSCTPVGCGDGNIDPGEECGEPGLSCAQGTRCVTAECSCETNSCGDPCASDTECPVGHRCDTSRGNCVIELCLNNANCTNNGCTLPGLPGTALIGKTQDRLLLGILSILIGLIAIRFNAVNNFLGLLEPLGKFESVYNLLPEGDAKSRIRGKKKEDFEERFEE